MDISEVINVCLRILIEFLKVATSAGLYLSLQTADFDNFTFLLKYYKIRILFLQKMLEKTTICNYLGRKVTNCIFFL